MAMMYTWRRSIFLSVSLPHPPISHPSWGFCSFRSFSELSASYSTVSARSRYTLLLSHCTQGYMVQQFPQPKSPCHHHLQFMEGKPSLCALPNAKIVSKHWLYARRWLGSVNIAHVCMPIFKCWATAWLLSSSFPTFTASVHAAYCFDNSVTYTT